MNGVYSWKGSFAGGRILIDWNFFGENLEGEIMLVDEELGACSVLVEGKFRWKTRKGIRIFQIDCLIRPE